MKHIGILIVALLLAGPASSHAVWSAFYSLNPTNITQQGKHHQVKVIVEPTVKGTNHFRVSVSSKRGGLGYWLVVATKPLPPEAQQFRSQLGFSQPGEDLELITKLQPIPEELLQIKTALMADPRKINTDSKGVVVVLNRDTLRRAYIYMDHEFLIHPGSTVVDGGAYYSIDLPKFFEQLEKK